MNVLTKLNIGQTVYLLHNGGPGIGEIQALDVSVPAWRKEPAKPVITYTIMLNDGMGSKELITSNEGTYLFASVEELLAEMSQYFASQTRLPWTKADSRTPDL